MSALESLLLISALVASFIITHLVRVYALKHGPMDQPTARSSHALPTPSGGGLAIVATFLGSILLLFIGGLMSSALFMALFGGGLLVAVVGFWDDHVTVPAHRRILLHFAAGAWALYWLGGVPPLPVAGGSWDTGWLGDCIGLLLLVWLLNLYNFMDGIDGLAAVESISVIAAAGVIMLVSGSPQSLFWLSLLGAATTGFLPWNWPPARIFMGDVGSAFLGFTLGVFAIRTAHEGVLPIWAWIILLGVFLVDATVTLLRRMLRGERWFEAHRNHAYQHAALRWDSHKRVTLAVLAINVLWLAPMAWFVLENTRYAVAIVCVALLPVALLALGFRAGTPCNAARSKTGRANAG